MVWETLTILARVVEFGLPLVIWAAIVICLLIAAAAGVTEKVRRRLMR